ncbi:uncharacterized protein B0I36DRAFT_388179 [Microdochium trichocladiopsis]|uniref:Zn(2)-C6 fungal-type domain-containing protein n=1 Tax=Microdochium trichocladiopsis TaxID=1682393 RepID=A0A9P8XZP4_9PEZI|nr:uncharacterized protein B0I36DRAFT_388179 [Microdochium trichocladiopsis]KAH7021489.1 hypothetical protein B0I36DRAFT_388179 [Microdochium trichocladiopsis]
MAGSVLPPGPGTRTGSTTPPAGGPRPRAKRRKYTAVACNECRRRKLKCLPGGSEGCCQRCAARGRTDCGYHAGPPAADHDEDSSARASSHRRSSAASFTALTEDVKLLRDTLAGWIASTRVSGDSPAPAPAAASDLIAASSPTPVAPGPNPASVSLPPLRSCRASVSGPAAGSVSAASPRNLEEDLMGPPDLASRVGREEPRFIGPTRSAYSFQAGGQALSRLGIPALDTAPVSGQQTPSATPPQQPDAAPDELFWTRCDRAEFERHIAVFQEEVESVYPCVESEELIRKAGDILEFARGADDAGYAAADPSSRHHVSTKEVHLATLAVATAIVLEGHGKTTTSSSLVKPVERSVLNILEPSRELKDLQLLSLLSIYYFHIDEDLLAWRTIGLAAREALVMGLHRKTTLEDMFRGPQERRMAIRVFWTIYALDRRWSFGTGLSFALVDSDIDPDLPEPDQNDAYLKCMVGYGRLSSTLWTALLPTLAQHNNKGDWTEEATHQLDLRAQEWLESIPHNLQLRHPRLGLAALAQPPVLQRLRALLYLRGNHIRILIYRYFLLSPSRIRSSYRSAWLAVEIAQDSLVVLLHLNESTSIYRRQQAAFNYFLVSALAVLFLAVCNDPETFAAPCKKSLLSAIGLLRGLSKFSYGSRRLWRGVRGIVPILRRLEEARRAGVTNAGAGEQQEHADVPQQQPQPQPVRSSGAQQNSAPLDKTPDITRQAATPAASHQADIVTGAVHGDCDPATGSGSSALPFGATGTEGTTDMDATAAGGADGLTYTTTPDFSVMGNELIDLFELFEHGPVFPLHQQQQQQQQGGDAFMGQPQMDVMNWLSSDTSESQEYVSAEQGAISTQFNWLI